MNILEIIIEFVVIFLVIYLLYYYLTIKKCQKEKNYIPVEVSIIIIRNKIDVKKINLYQMIKVVLLATSIILSLSIVIIHKVIKDLVLSLFIALLLSLILAIITYSFIGNYYKKKEIKGIIVNKKKK
jgi:hypothetical protein